MIGPEPTHKWDDKVEKVGELISAKSGGRGFPLYAIRGASDDEKRDFEKVKNEEFLPLARFYAPNIKHPYYTWEGDIVERDKISDRTLPLVN